jgi:hypothetical protein
MPAATDIPAPLKNQVKPIATIQYDLPQTITIAFAHIMAWITPYNSADGREPVDISVCIMLRSVLQLTNK